MHYTTVRELYQVEMAVNAQVGLLRNPLSYQPVRALSSFY